jgi:subtilisin family serine protease
VRPVAHTMPACSASVTVRGPAMKRAILTVSTALITFSLLTAARRPRSAPPPSTSPYIVVFKGVGDVDSQTGSLQQAFGFLSTFRYSYALSGFAARLTSAQVGALSRLAFVAFVSPDLTVQLADTAPIQASDSAPTDIRRIAAGTTSVIHGASGVRVAVIDTGGPANNPDLNAISGKNCISTGLPATDDNGHGTHCSGRARPAVPSNAGRWSEPAARELGLLRTGTPPSQLLTSNEFAVPSTILEGHPADALAKSARRGVIETRGGPRGEQGS